MRNRVTSWKINDKEKKNGEIIDYYNVFRNMRRALKDYAQGQEGQEAQPVQEKDELFKLLDDAIAQGMEFCADIGVDLKALFESKEVFKKVSTFEDYANTLLTKDEWRKGSLFTRTRSPASTKLANRRFSAGPLFAS